MTQLFCSDNLSSHAVAVLTRTKPGQPARPALLVSPHYLEAEEHEFCTPGVFKCLQWPLYRTRWNPVWDTDHFYCCPSKALININYSSADAQGIIPRLLHWVCKVRAHLTLNLSWKDVGSVILSSSRVTLQGTIPADVTCRWAASLHHAPTLATGTKKWLELMF